MWRSRVLPMLQALLSNSYMKILCHVCLVPFECGASDQSCACWCTKKPALTIDAQAISCLCEACYDKRLGQDDRQFCFRLLLNYNGAKFRGFQTQKNTRTVEEELKKAIFAITGQNIIISAAGRTDR